VNKSALIIAGLVLGAAGAWAADTVAAPPHGGPFTPRGGTDATLELAWDNGVPFADAGAFFTGADKWGGVDFDITTLSSYHYVASGKIYYWPGFPNNEFEGNRMAVWSFVGGNPGSILHGPTFVRATAFGWNAYAADYNLGATTAFVLGFEQYYNYPYCDPIYTMSSTGTPSHSWYYYGGVWRPMNQMGYGNYPLMYRAIMNDTGFAAVAPTSFGRVKAMYR